MSKRSAEESNTEDDRLTKKPRKKGDSTRGESKKERREKKDARREAKRKAKKLARIERNRLKHVANARAQSAAKKAAVVRRALNADLAENEQPYVESQELTDLPQSEIDTYLAEHHITTDYGKSEDSALRPITSFKFLPEGVHSTILKAFRHPTPIQAASWPYALAKRDLVGIAETGSGKTLAFAVPCIKHLAALPKAQGRYKARAIIISPTRELALQIHEQVEKIATPVGLVSVCVYGGVNKDEQRRVLKDAVIVVATPGRLKDLMNEGMANLSIVKFLVLDEADRMLDKGFEEDIKEILSKTPAPPSRQTMMFTATWPDSIRALAATFMDNPVKINIGADNPSGDLRANTRITQTVEVMETWDKEARLLSLIREHQKGSKGKDRILIFCLYKKEAVRVQKSLQYKGFQVGAIHGDLAQSQRTENLDGFKNGAFSLLVATDVAARGLDIPEVKLVINNTFPLTVEDYVHRIGRTGRAGKTGLAVTFFTTEDKALSGGLINVLRAANQPVPEQLLNFGGSVKKKGHEAYGAFYRDVGEVKQAKKIKFDD